MGLSSAEQTVLRLAGRSVGWKPTDDGPWWVTLPFAVRFVSRRLMSEGLIVKGGIGGDRYFTSDNPSRWNEYGKGWIEPCDADSRSAALPEE